MTPNDRLLAFAAFVNACLLPCGALGGEPESAQSPSPLAANLLDPYAEDGSKSGLEKAGLLLPPQPRSAWSFSFGAAYRHMEGVRYRGGTQSSLLSIPSLVGGDSILVPPIGPDDAYANRDYADGYVYIDTATETFGDTWYWGYDSASQVVDDTLQFHATGFQSIRSDMSTLGEAPDRTAAQDAIRPHIQIHYESSKLLAHNFSLGLDFGLNHNPLDQTIRYSNFDLLQTRDDYEIAWTDTYALNGVIPPLEGYEGTFEGPGPLIPNIPDGREMVSTLVNIDTARFTNAVTASFHGSLTTISAGPTLTYSHETLRFRASAGATLSILDWRARQLETLSVVETSGGSTTGTSVEQIWSDRESGLKLVPGLYLQAEVQWQFDEAWYLSAFGRIDVSDSPSVHTGPSSFEVDPAGYTIGLQVGRSF